MILFAGGGAFPALQKPSRGAWAPDHSPCARSIGLPKHFFFRPQTPFANCPAFNLSSPTIRKGFWNPLPKHSPATALPRDRGLGPLCRLAQSIILQPLSTLPPLPHASVRWFLFRLVAPSPGGRQICARLRPPNTRDHAAETGASPSGPDCAAFGANHSVPQGKSPIGLQVRNQKRHCHRKPTQVRFQGRPHPRRCRGPTPRTANPASAENRVSSEDRKTPHNETAAQRRPSSKSSLQTSRGGWLRLKPMVLLRMQGGICEGRDDPPELSSPME